jgi:pimeloyl-ACP methyl ester carboxylesterase
MDFPLAPGITASQEAKMGSQKKHQPEPPGQMVDVGGFRLHALVRGQGTPTVLLEPALGGFALQYVRIQSAVAAFTRVMAYDRAGQGWSDCSPNPRTPANLAGELNTLLNRLELQPPYVLVGHSFGGLLARFYFGFHPDDVAGVVLVDSSDVQQYDSFPGLDRMVGQIAMGVRLQKWGARLGLGKPLARLSMGSAFKSLSKEDLDIFLAIASQPKHNETMLAEFTQHRFYFGPHSQVPRTLNNTPLVILTSGKSVSGRGKFGSITIDQLNMLHQKWQAELIQLSSRAEHITLPEATHLSILTQPEHAAQVVEAIRRMVDRVRQESPLPVPTPR